MMIYQKAWRQAYVVGNLSRNNLIREDFPQRISQLKQTIQALSIDMKKTFSWNGMAKVEPNTTIPDTHFNMCRNSFLGPVPFNAWLVVSV
jgi:hypothetical protein